MVQPIDFFFKKKDTKAIQKRKIYPLKITSWHSWISKLKTTLAITQHNFKKLLKMGYRPKHSIWSENLVGGKLTAMSETSVF